MCHKISKLTDVRLKSRIKSIVVNKGRIHGELRSFQGILQIRSKLDKELSEKLGILVDLEREL